MSSSAVQYEVQEGVAVIRLDDGKANALSHDVCDALTAALDAAEKDDSVEALALIGRAGRFSAGFDLSIMTQGIEAAMELAAKGGRIAFRLYAWPRPVVFGVIGHAMAMGAVLLCTADERIGADGAFKIGLNETAIGMTLPDFAVELARERLSRRHFQRATIGAQIYSPSEAVDAGYLDTVVAPDKVAEAAIERARELATGLDLKAYAGTKRAVRAPVLRAFEAQMQG
jgi:enoyl-CoA hydratase